MAKLGSLSIACVQLGPRKLSIIRSSGVSMEGQSGLSELSVLSWLSAIKGCPLSGVPLYRVFAVEGCPLNGVLL